MSTSASTTRSVILDAARRLLEAHGYHGVGLDAIAREAGVSRQAVYLHFESKAGLLLALVEHVDEGHDLAGRTARIERAGSGAAMLDALVLHSASYTPLIYRIATVLETARRNDPDAEAAWQNRMANRYAGQSRLVQRLAAEGALAAGWSLEAATDLLWALTSIRVWEDLVIGRGWSKRRYVRHLRAVLRGALVR
jgi:AcrR family transcriptional regulator